MAQLHDLLSLMASLDTSSSKGELLGETSQTVQLLIPMPIFCLGCPLSFFFWLSPSHPPSLGSDIPSLSLLYTSTPLPLQPPNAVCMCLQNTCAHPPQLHRVRCMSVPTRPAALDFVSLDLGECCVWCCMQCISVE